jgi:hypothetical protein
MTKIFLSHAHEDKDAARQITTALAGAGLDSWLDVQKLRSGDELLKTIATVLAEVNVFAVLLSRTALAKSWVLVEMRMALTREIEEGSPKVIVLRLDDCEVPMELRHKVFLDFRGRFDAAVSELTDHVKGVERILPIPKQTILANMIEQADSELWQRLTRGSGSREKWARSDAAAAIRDLRPDELEAAVSIAWGWSGQDFKQWEDDLVRTIRRATDTADSGARRILRRLAEGGWLEEATDLDYREHSGKAWCDGEILWILRRAARRSCLFARLPPPMPERLSSVLKYEKQFQVIGKSWYAVHFATPLATAERAEELAIAAVAGRVDEAGRTWMFRSSDDRAPLLRHLYTAMTELTPSDPFPRAVTLNWLAST